MSTALQPDSSFNRLHPPLVRVETPNLEEEGRPTDAVADCIGHVLVWWGEKAVGNAVWDHEWVQTEWPHQVLHVPADRGDGRDETQAGPVDLLEREGVICIP